MFLSLSPLGKTISLANVVSFYRYYFSSAKKRFFKLLARSISLLRCLFTMISSVSWRVFTGVMTSTTVTRHTYTGWAAGCFCTRVCPAPYHMTSTGPWTTSPQIMAFDLSIVEETSAQNTKQNQELHLHFVFDLHKATSNAVSPKCNAIYL